MKRIKATARNVTDAINANGEKIVVTTICNWKDGVSKPSKKSRSKVLIAAKFMRLTEQETNKLMVIAGFAPEFSQATNAVFTDSNDIYSSD